MASAGDAALAARERVSLHVPTGDVQAGFPRAVPRAVGIRKSDPLSLSSAIESRTPPLRMAAQCSSLPTIQATAVFAPSCPHGQHAIELFARDLARPAFIKFRLLLPRGELPYQKTFRLVDERVSKIVPVALVDVRDLLFVVCNEGIYLLRLREMRPKRRDDHHRKSDRRSPPRHSKELTFKCRHRSAFCKVRVVQHGASRLFKTMVNKFKNS
jgi:hypothetical protein